MGDIEMDKCDFCKEIKPVERTYLRPSKYNKPKDAQEYCKLYNEGSYFIIVKTCSDCGVPKQPKSEPRMFSESQMYDCALQFFYYWWNTKGSNTAQGLQEWLPTHIQSISPKEVKPIETLPIPCSNFEVSYVTSSATNCKWCGLEEWQHKEFKKLSILPESSNPIATDHTTIEPNQTEAEKEETRVVQKIEKFVKDNSFTYGGIGDHKLVYLNHLLNYLQTFKKNNK